MIRVVKPGEKLAADDVVGKYVLRDMNYSWPAFGMPRLCVRVAGTRLTLEKAADVWDDERKIWLLSAQGERSPESSGIMLSSVKYMCDTPEEVNEVLLKVRELEVAWNGFREKAGEALAALDGLVVSVGEPGAKRP